MEISVIITIVGVLVALTNIMVEVLKKATWDKIPTNLVAIVVAEILTVSSGIAYCQVENLPMEWYTIAAFVVAGFMVAYAAMFGFDKLKQIMNWGNPDE